ncbi:MAG: NUDIX hydrolase [Pseudomonadales bacterium]
MVLPGGKSAPEDRDPMSTALRETHEEIGLEAANLRYLASLGIYYTHSGFRMSPEVFFFDGVAGWQTSAEVSEVLLVPLSALADPERYRLVWRTSDRGNYRFEYERQLISGPTISICIQLLHRLSERSLGPI